MEEGELEEAVVMVSEGTGEMEDRGGESFSLPSAESVGRVSGGVGVSAVISCALRCSSSLFLSTLLCMLDCMR